MCDPSGLLLVGEVSLASQGSLTFREVLVAFVLVVCLLS